MSYLNSGLPDLPQEKWGSGTGRQVILKGDFAKEQAAILQLFMAAPAIEWVDATEIKCPATADCPAQLMMKGFPNILHPGLWVGGGLTDGRYRENVADATLDFDLSASLWGTEKISQWYVVYALAGNADAAFTLKAMPMMRVCSQASQVISLGTLVTPATGRRYGFTADELAGGMAYLLTGASRGLMRAITANDAATGADGTSGTIAYGGTALTLAAGDWFVVLPPTNFRLISYIFNNSSGDLDAIDLAGDKFCWRAPRTIAAPTSGTTEDITCAPPTAFALGAIGDYGTYIGHPDGTNLIAMGNMFITYPDETNVFTKTFVETPIKNCKYIGVGAALGAIYFKCLV